MEKKEVKELEKTKMTTEDLKSELEKLRNSELKKALEEIQEVCKKYNCALDADFSLSRSKIEPRVFLVDLKQ